MRTTFAALSRLSTGRHVRASTVSCCSLREQDSATTTPGSSDLRSCRQVHPAVPEDAPATRAESTSIGRTAECWFDRERQQRRVGRQGQSRTGRRSPTARGRPLRAGGRRRISTGSSPDPPRPGRLRLAGCHRRHAPLRGRDTRWDGRIGWGVRLRDRLDGRGCGVGWRDARRNGRVGLFCGRGSSLRLPGSTRRHSSEAALANIRAASLKALMLQAKYG